MSSLLIGTTEGLFSQPYGSKTGGRTLLGFDSPFHGGIRTPVIADINDPNRLYAATSRSGVWRSDDAGKTWAEKNNGLIYKEVWWTEQHPVTGELYAGTGPVAIFRSRDNADTWEEITEVRNVPGREDWFLHLSPYFARIRTIALVPDDPDVIYCAIEEGWVIRTLDGGKTWENLRDAIGHDSHVAVIAPNNQKRILAATHQGVYLSDDAGDTFAKCEQFTTNYCTLLNTTQLAPKRVYGAGAINMPGAWRTDEGANSRFYVSDDAGDSWTRIEKGLPEDVHGGPRGSVIDPTDPDTYLIGTTDGSVLITRDAGKSADVLLDDAPGWVTALSIVA